mmetsp:Transcript_1907/g.11665  ORF Transcript_1907/g.11665 Transcript_1907/m.11665 type:complete len:829 (-) Transcript_1907:3898-6384(-)
MAGTRRIQPPTPGKTPGFCNVAEENEPEDWRKLEEENRQLRLENARVESELHTAHSEIARLETHLTKAMQQLEKQVQSEKLTLRLLERSQQAYENLVEDADNATHALASLVHQEEAKRERFSKATEPLCTHRSIPRTKNCAEGEANSKQQEEKLLRGTRNTSRKDVRSPCSLVTAQDTQCPSTKQQTLERVCMGTSGSSGAETSTYNDLLLQRWSPEQECSKEMLNDGTCRMLKVRKEVLEPCSALAKLRCSYCLDRMHRSTQWLVYFCQVAFWRYSIQAILHPANLQVPFYANNMASNRVNYSVCSIDVGTKHCTRIHAAENTEPHSMPAARADLPLVTETEYAHMEPGTQHQPRCYREREGCTKSTLSSSNDLFNGQETRMPQESAGTMSPQSPMCPLPVYWCHSSRKCHAKPTLQPLATISESEWLIVEEWLLENEQKRKALEMELTHLRRAHHRLESGRDHQHKQMLHHRHRAETAEKQMLELRERIDEVTRHLFEANAHIHMQAHELQSIKREYSSQETQFLQQQQDIQKSRNRILVLENASRLQISHIKSLEICLASYSKIVEEYQQEAQLSMEVYSSSVQFAEYVVHLHKEEVRRVRHLTTEILDIGHLAAGLIGATEQRRECASILTKSNLDKKKVMDEMQCKIAGLQKHAAERDDEMACLTSVHERLQMQLLELRSQYQKTLKDNEWLKTQLEQCKHNDLANHSSTALQSTLQEDLHRTRHHLVEAVAVIRSLVYLALLAHTNIMAPGKKNSHIVENHRYSSVAARLKAIVEMSSKMFSETPALSYEEGVWDSSLLLELVRTLEQFMFGSCTNPTTINS